jgi:hypothetical protein
MRVDLSQMFMLESFHRLHTLLQATTLDADKHVPFTAYIFLSEDTISYTNVFPTLRYD